MNSNKVYISKDKNSPSYISKCKENFTNGILPLGFENTEEYQGIKEIAFNQIKERGVEEFSYYLDEYQYLVNLWTAHLLLEFDNLGEDLENMCLETIKRYSKSSNINLANNELIWLNKYLNSK